MVICELEELQKHAKNDILAIRVSILTFNSIILPRVIVTIETTLYNHTVKKLLFIKNVSSIMNRVVSGNVRVRISASFGSHLNISSVASLNTPEIVFVYLVSVREGGWVRVV